MRFSLLLLLAAISLSLPLSGAGCDDFELAGRGARSRPIVNGGGERHIVVNGGEDWPGANPGPAPGPAPEQDGGAAPGTDGGAGLKPPDNPPPPNPAPKSDSGAPAPGGVCGTDFESQVFTLVNQERAKAGLSPYKCDPTTTKVAHDYSQLMCDSGQMGHSVGGTSPFQRMQAAGIKFYTAGENVAAGQQTPQQVMAAWMSSPGHRANILGNYGFIGVGYAPCGGGSGWGGSYWTQDFWK